MAKIRHLKEHVSAAEEYLGALCVARACVDKLTADRASLTAGTEQVKAECDPLAAFIRELEVAAATCKAELGVVVRAVRSLKGRAAACKDRDNTVQDRARKKLDKMSRLRRFVEVLNGIFSGERLPVAELIDLEFVCVWLVITAALSESEGMVSKAMRDVRDYSPVKASSHASGLSGRGLSDQVRSSVLRGFLLLSFRKCC